MAKVLLKNCQHNQENKRKGKKNSSGKVTSSCMAKRVTCVCVYVYVFAV